MEFFSRYKNVFLIIGFVLIVIVLGYFIYAAFFRTPAPTQVTSVPPSTTGGLPTAQPGTGQVVEPTGPPEFPTTEELTATGEEASDVALGGITKTTELINKPSMGLTLSGDGQNIQYYNKTDGKFYRIDQSGRLTPLSDKIFHEVENITWSPNKNTAVLEYPDGSNIVYDFATKKQITLPKHWEDFEFSPSGDQLVMKSIGLNVENRWLSLTNLDGSKVRILESLGDNADSVIPSWSPNNLSVAMYTEGIGFNEQEVYFVGLNDENFKSTRVQGRGFQPLWEPTGNKLVYSVYHSDDDYRPKLWVVDAKGESIGSNRKSLNVNTWADKCTFGSSNELYCAVPESMPEGAGLFPEYKTATTDHLYKINPDTGLKKRIAVPDGDYNMSNLIVSENGRQLYFTDSNTQKIYTIRLK